MNGGSFMLIKERCPVCKEIEVLGFDHIHDRVECCICHYHAWYNDFIIHHLIDREQENKKINRRPFMEYEVCKKKSSCPLCKKESVTVFFDPDSSPEHYAICSNCTYRSRYDMYVLHILLVGMANIYENAVKFNQAETERMREELREFEDTVFEPLSESELSHLKKGPRL
jgi:hypothetical protein